MHKGGGKRKGAGRKPSPSPNKIPITIRVNPAIAQWLTKQTKKDKTTRSKVGETIMTKQALYQITKEYDQTVQNLDIAYGNGFDEKGSDYFHYLCQNRPSFRQWVQENYPDFLNQ